VIVSVREMLNAVASADDAPPDPVLRRIRIPLIRKATLTRASGRLEELFVIDLGLAGVFVERPDALPSGEVVHIRFTLPGNEIPVQAGCRVAWWHPPGAPLVSKSLPSGVGLEFVEVSEHDRDRVRAHLLDYLRSHLGPRRFHRQRLSGEGEEP
jgi:Tfp pilus assembly protein PilZ